MANDERTEEYEVCDDKERCGEVGAETGKVSGAGNKELDWLVHDAWMRMVGSQSIEKRLTWARRLLDFRRQRNDSMLTPNDGD